MKAKEYYTKYGEQLVDPYPTVRHEALVSLMVDMADETKDIMEKRKIATTKAILALIEEMNSKWNALCNMMPTPVLRRNGYREFMYRQLAITKELADAIMGKCNREKGEANAE